MCRVPGLKALLLGLFSKLHDLRDPANLHCPYRALAEEIVALTTEIGVDLNEPPGNWPAGERENLLNQLVQKYPEVLAIPLQMSGGPQNVPWDLCGFTRFIATLRSFRMRSTDFSHF